MVPDWLLGVISKLQDAANAKYADELKSWKQSAAEWIAAQTISRDIGAPIVPFTMPVPVFQVWGANADNTGPVVVRTMDAAEVGDALPPVLPPPTPKLEATPFRTGAVADAARDDAMAADVKQVKTDVAAIRAFLHA